MVTSGQRHPARGTRRHPARGTRRLPEDADILELLQTVREVRTTLAIDLSAAAGALEENQPAVARDILTATSAELSVVGDDLRKPASDNASPRRSRRRRVLLALPAVPLVGALAMTTAAALNSNKPAHHVVATTSTQHTAASTALQRLEDVVTQHPQAAQVIAVADDLHKQLTQMIATSTNNPAQLHVVQQLLKLEQHVLESSKVPGTQLALAASRAIAKLLEDRPAQPHSKHSISSHTAPTTAPRTAPSPRAQPKQPQVHPAPQPHQSAPSTKPSPSPKPTNALFGRTFFGGF